MAWHDSEPVTVYWQAVAEAPLRTSLADPGPDYQILADRLGVPLEALALPPRTQAAFGKGATLEYYTVQAGESLWQIADRLDVHIADLVIANYIDDVGLIAPGTELIVPRLEAPGAEGDLFSIYGMATGGLLRGDYVVRPGDTLERIAATYALSPSTIRAANQLSGEPRPGEILRLPDDVQQIIPAVGRLYWPIDDEEMYLSNSFRVRHLGIDLVSTIGMPVKAVADGEIAFAGWSESGFGNLVIIDHGGGFTSHYAHLETITVAEGEKVDRENIIGLVGNTGN